MAILFSNLISNALKFAKKDVPPIITIASRILPLTEVEANNELASNVSYCEISFQDNGIGLDPQYAEKIFSIFARLHADEQYSGTGIGLAACKKIVLNHHGRISVTSSEGNGALFLIVLPLRY
jgi:signal transduction histidine kinase